MGPLGAAVSLGCDPDFVKRTRGKFAESYRINEKKSFAKREEGDGMEGLGGGGGTDT